MKLKRSVLAPVLVAVVASVSGGWLLQRGAADAQGTYRQSQILNEVMEYLRTRHVDERSQEELYRMAVEGLLTEFGDPHTSFLSAADYESLRVSTTGEYGGLGIQIAERDGWITVIAPLPGTPAERAGIMAGDRIVEIEGESTEGWSDDDAVKVLRGPKGQPVNIRVARIGVDEPIPYRVVRDEIHVKSVPYAFMLEPGIGYTRLNLFSETSTEELRAALNDLRKKGATGAVLDLRMNPGGLLDQGVSVADLFMEEGGTIVETRARIPQMNEVFRARTTDEFKGLRLVVVVDSYSASAAEIVAGALQDHDRALVLGTTTFGKGSVQSLLPLSGGNFLKVTTGKWYTPVGRSIQKDAKRRGDPVALTEDAPIAEDGVPVQEPADTTARKPYRTDTGRVVYGGGGIVPDVIVEPDTLIESEKEFFKAASKSGNTFNDVLFRYALEYGRSHPKLRRDFVVTPAMRQEFLRRLRAAGVSVTEEQVAAAGTLIDERLAQEIALHKFGQAVAAQRANASDNVIRTATEMLRSARSQQALFDLAKARKNGSPAPRS